LKILEFFDKYRSRKGRKEKGNAKNRKARQNPFAVLCETLCALCVNRILFFTNEFPKKSTELYSNKKPGYQNPAAVILIGNRVKQLIDLPCPSEQIIKKVGIV
jgi:hypothetical protein